MSLTMENTGVVNIIIVASWYWNLSIYQKSGVCNGLNVTKLYPFDATLELVSIKHN